MSDKKLHKLTVILTMGMLIAYLLDSEILEGIVVVATIGMIGFLYRDVLRQLSIWRILAIILFLVGIVSIAACFFMFIASPIVDLISIGWLNSIVTYAVIIIGLILTLIMIQKGLLKITNGKFPNTDIEMETEDIEYPINEEIKQLVDDEKVVQAVRLARESYGYSLLEAKRYVDSLDNN